MSELAAMVAPPTRWWISWVDDGAEGKPGAWPPPVGVIAFWRFGYEPTGVNVIAIVETASAIAAAELVAAAWSVVEWRFCREVIVDAPPGDRFPPPRWAVEMGRWPWPTTPRP